MKIKVAFASKLPWALAGLTHHHTSVVKAVAAHCCEEYDKLPQASHAILGSLTNRFLAHDGRGQWRTEMEALSRDGALLMRSDSFVTAVCSLRFCPLSERTIEAGHKDVKTPHGFTKFGPASAASNLRAFPMIVRPLLAKPDFFDVMVKCMTEMAKPSTAANLLHLKRHPQMQIFWQPGNSKHDAVLRMTGQVLYRCDSTSTYADLSLLRAGHDKQVLRLEGEALKALRAKEPLTMQALLAYHLVDHWRRKCSDGCILALPAGFDSLCPLFEIEGADAYPLMPVEAVGVKVNKT
eukprot:14272-Amphidinium_carterae.2